MNLKTLLKGQLFQASAPIDDDTITGVAFKSSDVQPGYLYVATKPLGTANLQEYIQQAVQQGAKFILKDKETPSSHDKGSVIYLNVMNTRQARTCIAANLFPGQPRKVVAITGTNGKTSVAHFLKQIWELLGKKAACLGTAGLYGNVDLTGLEGGSLTSPDPLVLHQVLSNLAKRGCEYVALEASSHGLDQHRLDRLDLTAAAFTNLSHDHLDYHQNMDRYFEAKCHLFNTILPEGSQAVLNADDFRFAALATLCRERGHRMITFGRESRDIQLINVDLNETGQVLEIKIFGKSYKISLALMGAIQSYNILCALGLALASGMEETEVIDVLPSLKSVPGRFEWVGTLKNKAKVFVDFAHTPHGLETLLTSLRPHVTGALNLVFGCGGDRDSLKRPLMGEIANNLADYIYVTDDNPRSEDPKKIRSAILKTCPNAWEIGNRQEAIATALAKCGPHDLCVIAGKGHEQGQILVDTVIPFDDRTVAQEEIQRLKGTLI